MYFRADNWKRWERRAYNLVSELVSLSKGLMPEDIKQSRDIKELAHFSGAIKHLMFAKEELHKGYLSTSEAEGQEASPF